MEDMIEEFTCPCGCGYSGSKEDFQPKQMAKCTDEQQNGRGAKIEIEIGEENDTPDKSWLDPRG